MSFCVLVFCCIVFRFPIIDDDLLRLCAEIDGLSDAECLIELGDIVTSNILLTPGHEMSLHHVRESVDQYVERLTIISTMSFFVWLHCLLECMDDLRRLTRIAEYE